MYMRVLHILWMRNKIVRTSIAASGRVGGEKITYIYIHFQFLYLWQVHHLLTPTRTLYLS